MADAFEKSDDQDVPAHFKMHLGEAEFSEIDLLVHDEITGIRKLVTFYIGERLVEQEKQRIGGENSHQKKMVVYRNDQTMFILEDKKPMAEYIEDLISAEHISFELKAS